MATNKNKVSETVIRRLPKYHRYLSELHEKGEDRISSQELSDLTGFTASQIRQDLNNFGGFGQQGYGYKVTVLKEELENILGISTVYKTIIIGSGRLGSVISNYRGFLESGFEIVAMFDRDEKVVGTTVGNHVVKSIDDLESYLEEHKEVTVAILTVPKEGAQAIAHRLEACGIRGIWNFAPEDLDAMEGVIVENIRLTDSLLTLSYYLTEEDR
ncbi:MAG: redox-sensing transcriptional repressor Rex [Peptoniphilus sp.]|nr:redox-sensing transcriptional repressor Rex [Peptoniphilus sp.]MDD7363179.1 redox-sensing transcriptional repressor Rex [Bacillota bacterium]MDY6044497.1 redox-sensing transcriptional repressor Rex [Peptoniphilus sp.]